MARPGRHAEMDLSPHQRCLALLARGALTVEDRSQLSSLPGEPAAWRALARSADDHGVVPTVVRNLRRLGWPGVPDDVRSHLETSERLNAARNAIIARGLRGVLERFARAGIPVVPLKGVTLA